MTWQVLEGKRLIPVCLIEAADPVDSGVVYARSTATLEGHELVDELRAHQARETRRLCVDFVKHFPQSALSPQLQVGETSYYPRRTPRDSELSIDQTISQQFNLIRVVDNVGYPAFFTAHGFRYILNIRKSER
jgi:methionyl-tRNA formyltransferase